MGEKLRIACVLATGEAGGAELALSTMASHSPAGIELSAVLMSGGPVADRLQNNGVPIQVTPFPGREVGPAIRFEVGLGRYLRDIRPSFVFAVGNKAVLASAPVTTVLRIPLLWYRVDLVMPRWQRQVVATACRMVVCMSRATAAGIRPEKRIVISPPVNLADKFRVASQRPVATLSCLARLEPTKGQHYLIQAAAVLRKHFSDVRVVLAGATDVNPGYTASLRRLAADAGVPLELTGHVDNVEDVLERTTVYVQPSFRDSAGRGDEGFGIALAEASWAALPVVATDTGGIPEVVIDETTGTLVPPCDPGALARAIARYLEDPDLAQRTGQAGAVLARERFDPHQASMRLFEFIAGLT